MTLHVNSRKAPGIRALTSGFSPLSLGPALWLKADAGAYSDAGVTLATNGQTIQQWNDQSGNGRHFSQAASGSRPTYNTSGINSLPALSFDGLNDFLSNASITLSSNCTIFSVMKMTGTAGHVYEHGTDTGSIDGFNLRTTSDASFNMRRTTLSAKTVALNWGVDNTLKICTQRHSGTHATHILRINGVDSGATTYSTFSNNVGTSNTTQAFYIGCRAGVTSFSNGAIGELIIYETALTDAQVAQVEAYLTARWTAVSAFSPLSLSPLRWYKSDAGVYSDAGITPAVNTDPVYRWADQSGNSGHAEQTVLAKRPTYATAQLNGMPAISLDGVDDIIQLASAVTLTGAFSIYIVAEALTATSAGFIFFTGNSAGSDKFGLSGSAAIPDRWVRVINAGSSDAGTDDWTTGITGSIAQLFRDASNKVDTALDNSSLSRRFSDVAQVGNHVIDRLGSDATNFRLMRLYEILIYPAVHSTTDRDNILTYLNSRYAVY